MVSIAKQSITRKHRNSNKNMLKINKSRIQYKMIQQHPFTTTQQQSFNYSASSVT